MYISPQSAWSPAWQTKASDHITDGCESTLWLMEIELRTSRSHQMLSHLFKPLNSFLRSPFPQMKQKGLGIF